MVARDQLLDVRASVLRVTQTRDMYGIERSGLDQAAQRFLRDSEDLIGFAPRNQCRTLFRCGGCAFDVGLLLSILEGVVRLAEAQMDAKRLRRLKIEAANCDFFVS